MNVLLCTVYSYWSDFLHEIVVVPSAGLFRCNLVTSHPFTSSDSSALNISIDTLFRVTLSLRDVSKWRAVTHVLFQTTEGWQIPTVWISGEAHVLFFWTLCSYWEMSSFHDVDCAQQDADVVFSPHPLSALQWAQPRPQNKWVFLWD